MEMVLVAIHRSCMGHPWQSMPPTCEPRRSEWLTPDPGSRNLVSTGQWDRPGGGIGDSSADRFPGARGVPARHRPAGARLRQQCLADRLLPCGLARRRRRADAPGFCLDRGIRLLCAARRHFALSLGRTGPYCPGACVRITRCGRSADRGPARATRAGAANASVAGAGSRRRITHLPAHGAPAPLTHPVDTG